MISLKTSVIGAFCVSIGLMIYSAISAIWLYTEGNMASFTLCLLTFCIGVYCTILNYRTYRRL